MSRVDAPEGAVPHGRFVPSEWVAPRRPEHIDSHGAPLVPGTGPSGQHPNREIPVPYVLAGRDGSPLYVGDRAIAVPCGSARHILGYPIHYKRQFATSSASLMTAQTTVCLFDANTRGNARRLQWMSGRTTLSTSHSIGLTLNWLPWTARVGYAAASPAFSCFLVFVPSPAFSCLGETQTRILPWRFG